MSGTITTLRGYQWTDGPHDLISALRLTAKPLARVDQGAIQARELITADIQAIAGGITPPPHGSYTTLSDVNIPAGTTAEVASIGGTFTLDQIILVDCPLLLFQFHAYVSSVSAMKIIARNTSTIDSAVLTGTVFKYAII